MKEPKTDIARLQAEKVRLARAEVERLMPVALRRWAELCPAFELRKLDALRRLLSPRSSARGEVA